MSSLSRAELLERVADHVETFLAYVDGELRYVYNNALYARWFGRTHDQIVGHSVRDLVGEERWREVEQHYLRALNGERVTLVDPFDTPAGGVGWGKVDLIPDTDEEGRVQGIFVQVGNVTELKKTELRLRRIQDQLEGRVRSQSSAAVDQQTHLRAITEAVPAGIGFFDEQARCRFTNRALASLAGRDVEATIGLGLAEVVPVSLPAEFLRGAQAGLTRHVEVDLPVDDGTPRRLELRAVPPDTLDGFYLLVYDLSGQESGRGRQRAELELAASQKSEGLGLMTRGLAHDFSNLVQALTGNLDLARRLAGDGSDAARFIDNALQSARRAGEFCAELLAYSGRTDTPRRTVDFAEICTEMVDLVRAQPNGEGTVDLAIADELPPVAANPIQLKQILLNLLMNARQAGAGRPVHIRVEVDSPDLDRSPPTLPHALPPGSYVRCRVRDDGLGMDERTLDRLFEPFFTTRSSGKGLGLSAVLGTLQGHGGGVEVESTPGRGSTFTVYLPTARSSLTATATDRPRTSGSGLALVVGTETASTEVSAEGLRGCGFDVFCAHDATEALDILSSGRDVRLVLLDQTSGADGSRPLERLREARPGVALIVITDDPGQAPDGVEVLPRSWLPPDLRRAVDAVLAGGTPPTAAGLTASH